ncbi:tail fiber assembly protein [Escherichia coli]|uniref:tail fiber assembly protein n=1 Tax=Escherichia coli TaxID=562 RepID=UPI001AECE3AE|nr:tail fiber assembly protein [Escherichia coli]MBP2802377.1 tail fiber assembly protein [Escherichia coli]MCV5205762.1 tail fiber assembly protein [Escherichia coli]MCV5235541.1 tail fiber assembly protein [Escherichia coli]MCV5304693.1 tail fiber assembly protein [Escherichia coli]MDW6790267.1 tail fiber assembly protein [Escherichia coli]
MMANYAVIENGMVVNVIVWDGVAGLGDGDQMIIETVDGCGIGWTYAGGEFIPPPVADQDPAELIASADAEKQNRLSYATNKIVVWQTKLLMGRTLTDSESAKLNAWMDYIDAVQAIDTSTAPDINWPEPPAA